jgi:hypothetical protein
MKVYPFEFSTCSLGLLTTYQPQASFRIFDQFPWPTYYLLPASSQLSNFRPVPLAYLLPTSLKPAFEFSTSSLGLLTTCQPQPSFRIFDQFPWPTDYLRASSQDLKSRKVYFQTLLLHLKKCWEKNL